MELIPKQHKNANWKDLDLAQQFTVIFIETQIPKSLSHLCFALIHGKEE